MADYKKQDIVGTQFTRCNRIEFSNPLGADFRPVTFHEENVLNAQWMDKPVVIAAGRCQNALTDGNGDTAFPLVNHETGEVVGQATYKQVYEMLASLYLYTAMLRDHGINGTT